MISKLTQSPSVTGVLHRPRVGFGQLDEATTQAFIRPTPLEEDEDTFERKHNPDLEEVRDRIKTAQNNALAKALKSDFFSRDDLIAPLSMLAKHGLTLKSTVYETLTKHRVIFSPEITRLILLCQDADDQ